MVPAWFQHVEHVQGNERQADFVEKLNLLKVLEVHGLQDVTGFHAAECEADIQNVMESLGITEGLL